MEMEKEPSSIQSLSLVVGSLGKLLARCDQPSFDGIIGQIVDKDEFNDEARDGYQRLFDGLDDVVAGVWRSVQPNGILEGGKGNG